MTRRGLLAAGAAGGLALAGCGSQDEHPPPDAELLAPSLAAATALADAYERAGGRLGGELAAREREHARRLRAAGAKEDAREVGPGGPIPLGVGPGGQPPAHPLEAALALEQAAMRANVHATGLVRSAANRELTAELLADSARHTVQVRARLGREPLTTAFPDGRDDA